MIKQKDISKTLGVYPSEISRIVSKERQITVSMAQTLKSILGGQLEDYLHKRGSEAVKIFSCLKDKAPKQKKEVA